MPLTLNRKWKFLVAALALAVLAGGLVALSGNEMPENPLARGTDPRAAAETRDVQTNGDLLQASTSGANDPAVSATQPAMGSETTKTCIGVSLTPPKDCPPPPEGKPFIKDLKKVVTWDEAAEWWRHASLLRADRFEEEAVKEQVYALPHGLKESPDKNRAAVSAFYGPPAFTVDRVSYWAFIDKGGISITARYFAPGTVPPFGRSVWTDREVTVRGRRASLNIMTMSSGDANNWRTIRWNVETTGGGFVQWEVGNHPDLYTDAQTVAFVDALALVSASN